MISRHGVQYSLKRQLEIGGNIDGKSAGAPKVSTASENNHFINESKKEKENCSRVES